ncbi:NUDIX domain-containing protein [Kitasatospora sp. DSM 101779]|uniref:NUDIX domain-containing protein n=1 Tax=Kitasatospora sp. DSM 101779 TaxID=2853165 RepID=UPI0021DB5675|nr:NUDIX domain-containing protein [Kitasatospora sp. DSM 101779]MCU7826596.1 NUDIX domain-containing protein [Kitasatospora sp. DSM 101779]
MTPPLHQSAPAVHAEALIRDERGRILLVRPGDGDGWELPGSPVADEEPARTLLRTLAEGFGGSVETGRLLAVDTVSTSAAGRTVLVFVHAVRTEGGSVVPDTAALHPEQEALALLLPPAARRLAAAIGAEHGAHTAVLRDGHRTPMGPRDHYAQLPAPMAAATALVTDTAGRVLVLHPGYKDHLELPGGMVEAHEAPGPAAARELMEELALDVPVGRLLVVDTAPASATRHGRALTCFVFDTTPLTPQQAGGLVFADGEIRAATWLPPEEAVRRLPPILGARVTAALRARETGILLHLEAGRPTWSA